MNSISELEGILGETFAWNKARLSCFARVLQIKKSLWQACIKEFILPNPDYIETQS